MQKSNYQDYLKELSEDFHHICAYCGKKDIISKNSFEIDHYIPKKLLKKSEYSLYSNLFYCCHTCNRKKSSKWPTGNRDIDNDGNIGLINPTSTDYDLAIEKNDNGEIVSLTPLGEYLIRNVFQFNLRPMQEIYKIEKIYEYRDIIHKKMTDGTINEDEKDSYIKLHEELLDLERLLRDNKE
jgi:Restriction endonuclease